MASPLAKDHYVLASSSFPFLLLHKLNRRGSVGMDDGKKRKLETYRQRKLFKQNEIIVQLRQGRHPILSSGINVK